MVGTKVNTTAPVMGKMHKHTHYNVKSAKVMVFAKCCVSTDFLQAGSIFLSHRRQLGVLAGTSIEAISSSGPSTEPGT